MQIEEKIIQAMSEANVKVIEVSTKAIDVAEKYNKRIFILFLSMVVSFTIIIFTCVYCYFKASYGENYQQNITQEVTQEVDSEQNFGTIADSEE